MPRLVQLHLRDGVAAEVGPCVGQDSDEARHPDPFSYYVLVEPLSEAAWDLCPHAVRTLLRHVRGRRGTVTTALERGVQEVHRQAQRGHHVRTGVPLGGLGLACAALRGQELYLALAGPTVAVLISDEGVETLSAARSTGLGHRYALGTDREPMVRLYRRELTPATTLLLLFSSGREAVPLEALRDVAGDGAEAVLAEVYRHVGAADCFVAAALVAASGNARVARPYRRPPEAAAPRREERPAPPPSPEPPEPALPLDSDAEPEDSALPAMTIPPLPPPRAAPARPPLEAGPSQPVSGLGLELRPPRRISSRRVRGVTISPTAVLIVATIIAAVALGLALWYLQAQAATSRESRYQSLQTEAASLYDAALATPSRDEMRQKLLQARESATAAAGVLRDAPETRDLLDAIGARLAELDAVTSLADPKVLVDLRMSAASTSLLRDPVLLGADLVVLDQGADRVYRLPTGDVTWRLEAPPLLPVARGTAPRGLRRLAWMPRGALWNRDALLGFDESRALWEYGLGGSATPASGDAEWRRVPLRGAAEWGGFEKARGYTGNLYVLDPPSSQIWRYLATDTGFDSERTGALTAGGDLRQVVDFVVDGDIYVLLQSGKVQKFSGGRPQVFSMDGLGDRPLAEPSALYTSPDAKQLYVADTGNQRIVVFDKEGVFQRQITLPSSLPPVADLLADETRGVLYLICDRQVTVAQLPK